MRKYTIAMVLGAIMILLCACGRKNRVPETVPTTTPAATTAPTTAPTMPETMPTLETNIPDPTVNSNSTENETMNGTDTDQADPTENTDSARIRRNMKRIS